MYVNKYVVPFTETETAVQGLKMRVPTRSALHPIASPMAVGIVQAVTRGAHSALPRGAHSALTAQMTTL